MKKADAFATIPRRLGSRRTVKERIRDFREFLLPLSERELVEQAERCMDCGVPFCHGGGCPVDNLIPLFNAAVSEGRWREALQLLQQTNPFPEITGRICPAPCEHACTLDVHREPVTIRQLELAIVERGFEQGWITPAPPVSRSGKRVAVIGSGPAGLAVSERLNRYGHTVTVLEKSDRIGGLLRYGVPDFKLEKKVLDRRIDLLRAEGIEFLTEVEAGKDLSARYLLKYYDALCLAGGAEEPRKLVIAGAELAGIHLAMDFLVQQNRRTAGDTIEQSRLIDARDKKCVVLGGGDTGADCVGTARRQGAKEIVQLEILPRPPESRTPDMPWPTVPRIFRASSSHEEGCTQRFNVLTKEFTGSSGKATGLRAVEVQWSQPDDTGRRYMGEIPGTEFEMEADLIILALGFTGPVRGPLLEDLGIALEQNGSVAVDVGHQTSAPGVFCAGDMQSGPSTVVNALKAGREAAAAIHHTL